MIGLPLLLLLLWLLPPSTAEKIQTMCVLPKQLKFRLELEFYRPGDLIIGGNLPLVAFLNSNIPAFREVPTLLLEGTLREEGEVCHSMLMNLIGGVLNHTMGTLNVSIIIGSSFFSQLGVGFEFSRGDRRVYPSFFRINPKESAQCEGLVQLLLHFHWNWVGLVTSDNDNGEQFLSSLVPMLKEKDICLAFTEMMKSEIAATSDSKLIHIFNTWSKHEVIIMFGDSNIIVNIWRIIEVNKMLTNASFLNVWIFTSSWKFNIYSQYLSDFVKPFHGALHFKDHTRDVSEFSHVLLSLDPLNPQGDFFLCI
ncbi:hypothetical protein E2320_022226, partial [Naja naja]